MVNLAKIAESLDVNLIQLFAYIEEEFEVTEDEKQIKEIVQLLRDSSPDNIRVAKNVIKGILM